MKKSKIEVIGGKHFDIYYDRGIRTLSMDFAVNDIGSPLVIVSDWTGKKAKELFTLHLDEALELKSTIDSMVLEWINYLNEKGGRNEKERL